MIEAFAEELYQVGEGMLALRNGDPPAKAPQLQEVGAVGTPVTAGIISDPFETAADFTDAARWQTIRNMVYGDAKVYGTHQARMLPLRQAQWKVVPDPSTDEIANAVHRALFETMDRPWREVIYDATMAPRWGFSLLEKVWKFDERDRRWVWSDWAMRLPWTIEEWNVDRRGRLLSVVQEFENTMTGQTERVTIPRRKLILFTHERVGSDFRGTPLCRYMFKHYRLKLGLEKIDAVALERNAMGVPAWRLPRIVGTGDGEKAENIVENVRTHERGGVVIPFGHDFSIEGVQGTIRDGVPSVRYHGEEISLVSLAGFLDLGKTQSGARALADPQLDLFQLVLLGDALYDCDVMNREAVREFVDLNFGPQETYPVITCTLLTNRNLERWLESISKAKESGTFGPWSPADEEFIRRETALPQVDEAQRAKEEAEEEEEKEAERARLEAAAKPGNDNGDAGPKKKAPQEGSGE